MKLTIGNIPYIFQNLQFPIIDDDIQGEEWKPSNNDVNALKREATYFSDSFTLPLPLKECGIEVEKYHEHFLARFFVIGTSRIFKDISHELPGRINEPNELWIPTRENCVGFITKKSNPQIPTFSIGLYENQEYAREIVIGSRGTETQILTPSNLEAVLFRLGVKAESFLNILYSGKRAPQLDLTISP